MTMKDRTAALREIRKQLKTGKPLMIMEAIRLCREEGHPELVTDLMDALAKRQIPSIRESIISLLNDLNQQQIAPVIANYIKTHNDHPELPALVSACWQSRLNFFEHIPVFVDLLIEKDYPVALEAFTVIETYMHTAEPGILTIQAERLQSCIPLLDNDKKVLVREMITMLKSTVSGSGTSGE